MGSDDIKIDLSKENSPFKLGQYILKLLDVIKTLRAEQKKLKREKKKLQNEIENLKKKLD